MYCIIDLTVATCHIQYPFLSLCQFFSRENGQNTKILEVRHFLWYENGRRRLLGAQSINTERAEPEAAHCSYGYRPLTRLYQEVARTVFSSGTGDQKRKSHSEVQEKVNLLWANTKLFDKGIKLFSGKLSAGVFPQFFPFVLISFIFFSPHSSLNKNHSSCKEALSDRNTSDLTATVLPREDS